MKLIDKFKILSQIKIGQTLCTNDLSIVNRGTFSTFIKRTWYSENQDKLLSFLRDLLSESKIELNKPGPEAMDLARTIKLSLIGIDNLAKSYVDVEKTNLTILQVLI